MIITPISISENKYEELIKIDILKSRYNEDWLQKIIHDNPQSYPIENPLNIDTKIISLGREVKCEAGYIDILLLTSNAELIVIETKLWKNSEKSRTVLAQVIDYAKEICKWDYNDLNRAVLSSQRAQNNSVTLSLIDIINKEFPNRNQTDFLEILLQNIQQGIMNLSIIGDKISPNLILLSDTIQNSPGLNFNLKLIEMKLYSLRQEIIMIPDIVGKTKEVIRGVVKIQYEQTKPNSEVVYTETVESQTSAVKTDKNTFISQCPEDIGQILDSWIDRWQNNTELMVYWGITGLSVRRQVDDKWTTLIDIYPYTISLITKDLSVKNKIQESIYNDYLESILSNDVLKSAYSSKKRYIKYSEIDSGEIKVLVETTGKLIDQITLKKERFLD